MLFCSAGYLCSPYIFPHLWPRSLVRFCSLILHATNAVCCRRCSACTTYSNERAQGPANRLLHSVPECNITSDATCIRINFPKFLVSNFDDSLIEYKFRVNPEWFPKNSYSNQWFTPWSSIRFLQENLIWVQYFRQWQNSANGFSAMFADHCPGTLCSMFNISNCSTEQRPTEKTQTQRRREREREKVK